MSADDGLVPVTLAALRKAAWKCARLQAGTARGGRTHLAEAGWPDIIALRPGRVMGRTTHWVEPGGVVLVECKAAKGKLREAQELFAAWCETHGYEYVVIRDTGDVARLVEGRSV